jgi:hypothetical protein
MSTWAQDYGTKAVDQYGNTEADLAGTGGHSNANGGDQWYTVRAGDSPASIAGKMYGDQRQFANIIAANGGAPLHPGMRIYLPTKQTNPGVSDLTAAAWGMATSSQIAKAYNPLSPDRNAYGKMNWTNYVPGGTAITQGGNNRQAAYDVSIGKYKTLDDALAAQTGITGGSTTAAKSANVGVNELSVRNKGVATPLKYAQTTNELATRNRGIATPLQYTNPRANVPTRNLATPAITGTVPQPPTRNLANPPVGRVIPPSQNLAYNTPSPYEGNPNLNLFQSIWQPSQMGPNNQGRANQGAIGPGVTVTNQQRYNMGRAGQNYQPPYPTPPTAPGNAGPASTQGYYGTGRASSGVSNFTNIPQPTGGVFTGGHLNVGNMIGAIGSLFHPSIDSLASTQKQYNSITGGTSAVSPAAVVGSKTIGSTPAELGITGQNQITYNNINTKAAALSSGDPAQAAKVTFLTPGEASNIASGLGTDTLGLMTVLSKNNLNFVFNPKSGNYEQTPLASQSAATYSVPSNWYPGMLGTGANVNYVNSAASYTGRTYTGSGGYKSHLAAPTFGNLTIAGG